MEGEAGDGDGAEATAGDFEAARPRGSEGCGKEEEQGAEQEAGSALKRPEEEACSGKDLQPGQQQRKNAGAGIGEKVVSADLEEKSGGIQNFDGAGDEENGSETDPGEAQQEGKGASGLEHNDR